LAEAFASFDGAAGRNQRWSWSARSADGSTVVIALWKDRFDYSSRPVSYGSVGQGAPPGWTKNPGNRERLENLKWARDHCGGLFRVVVIEAADPNASPRQIASCHPLERITMRITDLDETTGEFRAEMLESVDA